MLIFCVITKSFVFSNSISLSQRRETGKYTLIDSFGTLQLQLMGFSGYLHSRIADFLTNNLTNSLQWSGKRGCEELHARSSMEDVAQRDKQVNNGTVASQPDIFNYFVIHKRYVIGKLDVTCKNKRADSAVSKLFSFFKKGFFIKGNNWIAISWTWGVN